MSFSQKYDSLGSSNDNGEHFLASLWYYLSKVHWFILTVSLSIYLAHLKFKYETPYYQATSKVLFKTDENGSMFSENSAFQDLGAAYYTYSPIENEIEILKSRSLMEKVVKDLKLNVVFYDNNGLIQKELYEDVPFSITFLNGDSSIYKTGARYDIKVISGSDFQLVNEKDNFNQQGEFGKPIKSKLGEFILTPGNGAALRPNTNYTLYVYELENIVDQYAGQVQVERKNEMSNVIELSLIDNSIQKAKDIVNTLIRFHQLEAISDKNQVAKNSANFINDRIKIIASELADVEGTQLNFKSSNNIIDVGTEATLFAETQQVIEQNIVDNQIQVKMAEYVNEYLINEIKTTDLLPTNLGLNDQSITQAIETYNNLVLERNRILKNSNEKNPVAYNLESKIKNLQDNLKLSLNKYLNTLKLRARQLDIQNQKISNRIAAVPSKEKALREIQRQQQTKESLYLYLLQKREETAITLSLTVANSRVIDPAHSNGNIVSPSKKNYYLIALIFGLGIPFVLFFVLRKTNFRIRSASDIERQSIKLFSEIPQVKYKNDRFVFQRNEQSAFAESVRLLRTNIEFELSTISQRCRLIQVTSSIPNEGKSFLSVNLAQAFAITGKKVLLLGMDLRSPALHKYLQKDVVAGVSNFIADPELKISDLLITASGNYEFDTILSGVIPPNPSELLMHERSKDLFASLELLYDYIIVDSPPAAMVSDAFLMNHYADLTLYLFRENYTPRKYLKEVVNLDKEEKLNRLKAVLNSSKSKNDYGYYQQKEMDRKPWQFKRK